MQSAGLLIFQTVRDAILFDGDGDRGGLINLKRPQFDLGEIPRCDIVVDFELVMLGTVR